MWLYKWVKKKIIYKIDNYKNKLKGEYKSYHNNGQLNEICNYNNGKRDGEYKKYHKNCQLCEICNYINGLKGECKSYYLNGLKGECKSYYLNGQLEKIYNYKNGEEAQ